MNRACSESSGEAFVTTKVNAPPLAPSQARKRCHKEEIGYRKRKSIRPSIAHATDPSLQGFGGCGHSVLGSEPKFGADSP